MELKPEKISQVIRSQIKNYQNAIIQNETGTVLTVGDGISRVSGLVNCMAGELLEFENGTFGMAQNLEETSVSAVLFGEDKGISEGQTVKRTGRVVSVPVGEAMIGISPAENVLSEEADCAKSLLEATGKAEIVSEKLMDGVTAVSGSGPAFVFMFIEALADAAVRCGMPRAQAYTYAAQTVYGSAGMVLESGKIPAALKDMVSSPAGTTIEGIAALERNGFRNAVIEAITAACNRSIELGK